jgi:hypothetical protein
MPIKTIKNSFNAGELSEYMAGRTDINKYHNGCSKLINATVLPHGGVVKRPGTEFIAQAPNKANLLPFEFSVDDSLVLEFSNLLIRFYKDGDRVLETAVNITGATQANPVVVTTSVAHNYLDGEVVRIASVVGMTELNGRDFIVANKNATDFELTDLNGTNIDGTGFTAYTSGGTTQRAYQIVSPYTSEESFEIHYTQSADVMYIAHEDHPPQKLSRNGDLDWTIADVEFTQGPFLTENLDDTALMGFARTGGTARSGYYFPVGATGTLTATGGHTPFLGTANDVGTFWQINHTRPDNTTSTSVNATNTAPTSLTNAIKILGDFTFDTSVYSSGDSAKLWRKEGNGEWQEERHFSSATIYTATEEIEDVYYAFTVSVSTVKGTLTAKNQINHGVVKVTAAVSTTVATVIVTAPVLSNNSSDAAVTTSMWAEGAWGEFRGYPRTVTFFEDRLWWASSTNNPDTLWGSKNRLYEDHTFTSLGLASDAIIAPLKDNESSQVQWMQARQVMAVGAANKEYRFGNPDPDKAVTPEPGGAKSTPQTSFGSSNIQPVILNDAIFYFQRQGRKLRAMKFDSVSENFTAADATLLSNTILESPPVRLAAQRVPDSILWVVREDGVLLSFTYEPDEEVSGWARHLTQNSLSTEAQAGYFESVTVIHGSEEDEIWVAVRRIVDGNTVRYVEKFSTRFIDQLDEATMFDSAKINATGTVSGVLIIASDTVRFGAGTFGSSRFGGTA